MMLNCQENSSIHTSGSVMSLTPYKLKTWWQSLSLEEKEKVCMVDAPHVMSDLATVANNALVVCKLNHTYKKKDLISWTKFKDDDGAVLSQTFEFNLKGKDLLDNFLAELFSSFYISIARDHKQTGTYPSYEGNLPTQNQQKSLIGVKREKLDFILDLLSYAVPNFGEGQKFLFQKKDFLELYSFFITNPFQQVPAFVPLPPHIQTLFDRLSVVSSLLEYQINLAYYEGTIACSTNRFKTPEMSDQLNDNFSTIISDFEAMKNTNLPVPEPSGDQNSTASGSPGNPVVLNTSQNNINIEELSQKLLQKTTKDNSTCSIARELSSTCLPSDVRSRVQEELTNPSSCVSPSIYFGNEEQDEIVFMYEGCLVGDLQVLFDPVDAYLVYEDIEKEDESKEEYDWVERGFDEPEEGAVLEEQFNNDKYEEEKSLSEGQGQGQGDLYYNNNGGYGQVYPQQGFYNNNTDYYNQYYPQQFNNNMPYNNYGASNMMGNYNNCQQMNYQVDNGNYGYYNKNSYEYQQSGFAGDRDYYQGQSYGEYSQNNYNTQQSSEMMTSGEKTQYYGGKDRSRYEARPKLPPRFQRMKNNVFRS